MDEPVWHIPKEETGGGSAWASGFIYGLLDSSTERYADPRSTDLRHVLRSADVLSALCQESVGDHSTVRLPGASNTFRSIGTYTAAKLTGLFFGNATHRHV